MSNMYDDARYGVIERHTIGLTKKHGGDAGSAITFNETQSAVVTRWYPKGPIQLLKLGAITLATLGKGEEQFILAKTGTGGTTLGTVVASTTSAPYTIASKSLTGTLGAGSYISILASTNVCSTGTVALFIEYRRMYNVKWDPSS